MKTKIYILITFFATFLIACDKEKYLRVPTVETISVQTSDNNIIVSGKVIDSGNTWKLSAGVYFAQGCLPSSTIENQILLDVANDGTFQAVIPQLKEDSTYYFGTFVLNAVGFGLGDIITFKVPRFSAPEIPCGSNLQKNQIKDENQSYAINRVSGGLNRDGVYGYEAQYTLSHYYTFIFRDEPKTGIYQTVADHIMPAPYTNRADIVEVIVNKKAGFSFLSHHVDKMQQIYVDRTNPNKIIISFCGLKYSYNVSGYNIDTELQGCVEVAL